MTQQNRNIQTRVGYTVDQSSVAAVQAANTKVAASFVDASAAASTFSADVLALNPGLAALAANEGQAAAVTQALADTTVLTANTMNASFTAVDTSVKNVIRDIGDLGRDIENLPQPDIGSLPGEAAGGGGGSAASALGSARNAAIALPGVGFQSPLVLGLRAAEKAADATGASMLQLGVAAGLVGAAFLILKVGLDKFNELLEGNKNRLDAALVAQSNYYDAILTLTTAQAEATIAERERKQAILETQLAETNGAIEAQKGSITGTSQLEVIGKALVNQVVNTTGATSALTDRAKDLEQQLAENGDTITRLKQGVESGTFATNDLAEAERLLKEARVKAANELRSQLDEEAAFRLHAATERRNGSSEAVKEEIQVNQDRVALINNYLIPEAQRLGLSYRDLTDEAAFLAYQNGILYKSVLPVIEAREQEAKALKEYEDAFNDAFENMGKAIEEAGKAAQKVAEAQQAIRDNETQHADKLREIADAEAEKEADARADAAEKEADVRTKANKDAEDDQRKHLEKVAEIEQQYARDAEAAVGNRDALALYKAQQKRSDDLDKESVNYAERQKALQDHLTEQLEAIQKNLDKQLAAARDAQHKAETAENQSYQKRQQQLIRALNDAQVEQSRAAGLALGYQKQANEAQLREQVRLGTALVSTQQAGNVQQQNLAVIHQNSLINIAAGGAATIERIWANMWNNLASGSSGGSSGGGGGGGGGTPNITHSSQVELMVDRRVAQIVRAASR